jgi:hypothetical protein
MFTTAFFVQDVAKSLSNLETLVLILINKTGANLSELKTKIKDLKKAIKRPVFDQTDNLINERTKQIEERKKSEAKGNFYVR